MRGSSDGLVLPRLLLLNIILHDICNDVRVNKYSTLPLALTESDTNRSLSIFLFAFRTSRVTPNLSNSSK